MIAFRFGADRRQSISRVPGLRRARLLVCGAVFIAALSGVTAPRAVHSLPVTDGDNSALMSGPIMDLAAIAAATDFDLVGRGAVLTDVTVERVSILGFWVSTPHASDSIFIFPAERSLVAVRVGETVSLQGEVRAMPEDLRATLNPRYAWDTHLYVYAYMVRPAWPPLSRDTTIQASESAPARG